jgi:carboxylesterase type B
VRASAPATESLLEWPRYDATRRATMHLGRECVVEDAPMEEERRFWASLM